MQGIDSGCFRHQHTNFGYTNLEVNNKQHYKTNAMYSLFVLLSQNFGTSLCYSLVG